MANGGFIVAADTGAITTGSSIVATGKISAGSLVVTGVDEPFKVDVGGKVTGSAFDTGGGLFSVTATVDDGGNLIGGDVTAGALNVANGEFIVAADTGAITTTPSIVATGQISAGSLVVTGVDEPFKVDVGGKVTGSAFDTGDGGLFSVTATVDDGGNLIGGDVTAGALNVANGEFIVAADTGAVTTGSFDRCHWQDHRGLA